MHDLSAGTKLPVSMQRRKNICSLEQAKKLATVQLAMFTVSVKAVDFIVWVISDLATPLGEKEKLLCCTKQEEMLDFVERCNCFTADRAMICRDFCAKCGKYMEIYLLPTFLTTFFFMNLQQPIMINLAHGILTLKMLRIALLRRVYISTSHRF